MKNTKLLIVNIINFFLVVLFVLSIKSINKQNIKEEKIVLLNPKYTDEIVEVIITNEEKNEEVSFEKTYGKNFKAKKQFLSTDKIIDFPLDEEKFNEFLSIIRKSVKMYKKVDSKTVNNTIHLPKSLKIYAGVSENSQKKLLLDLLFATETDSNNRVETVNNITGKKFLIDVSSGFYDFLETDLSHWGSPKLFFQLIPDENITKIEFYDYQSDTSVTKINDEQINSFVKKSTSNNFIENFESLNFSDASLINYIRVETSHSNIFEYKIYQIDGKIYFYTDHSTKEISTWTYSHLLELFF